MNPSKENARKAKDALTRISHYVQRDELPHGISPFGEDPTLKNDFDLVKQFLEAAERKLPHEASFAKQPKF